MKNSNLEQFLESVRARDPHQPEFMQAVTEVMGSLWPFIQQNPHYADHGLLERLVEPERIIQFRVSWVNDQGKVETNRAFRIQHSNAIGPYKGGLRFHPDVNLSVLKFLAFEQTFKNALTTLPMGGAKGGSDFNPKNRSDNEIMRFCQAITVELHRHLGPDTDIPAGDIGVGGREIGFMAGMAKKLTNSTFCLFTGKGSTYGGSLIRPEATGYGLVYFVDEMLKRRERSLDGLTVSVSGSGNVAQYAIEKCLQLGAKVVTVSDSHGFAYDPAGFDAEKLQLLMHIKNEQRGRVEDYARAAKIEYITGKRPWDVAVDIALPCATQNELDANDAKQLLKNGVLCVAEGANMPCTLEAVELFVQAKILYAPGKASNAGGVAVSGLEICQNAQRLHWTRDEVDTKLQDIMCCIHQSCMEHGESGQYINYVDGANISGFIKVADAMLQQGVH